MGTAPSAHRRWHALLLAAVLLLCARTNAGAQVDPPAANPVDLTRGSTVIPVPPSGDTEVLGAERAATSTSPASLSLEQPIDPDAYICGPGDTFEINFWGRQNFRLRIAADLEGRAFISKVGFVEVAGQSLSEVRKTVKQKLRRHYPGLKFEVALSVPRSFLVHVVGSVLRPGLYAANPLDRVSAVLSRAGDANGSRRRIAIRREGTELIADLLLYERTGETSHNPYVLDGDVIYVPLPEVVASVSGAVRRPGRYELVRTKDVEELLDLAQGFDSTVTRTLPARLLRCNADEKREYTAIPFDTSGALKNVLLADDDALIIPSTNELQPYVWLVGAVAGADPLDTKTEAQRLEFVQGDTVRSLIERAGGIQTQGDLHRAYITRAEPGSSPSLIPLDLDALLNRRDFSADEPVRLGDTIVVPRLRRSILVEGAVRRPGLYEFNPQAAVQEYLANAGGRTRMARGLSSIRIIDPSGKTRKHERGAPLRPGDTILVPERNWSRAETVQLIFAGAGLVLSAVAVTLAATR